MLQQATLLSVHRNTTGFTREHLLHASTPIHEAMLTLTRLSFAGFAPAFFHRALTTNSVKDDVNADRTRPITALSLPQKLCDSRVNAIESPIVGKAIRDQHAARGRQMDTANLLTHGIIDDAEATESPLTMGTTDMCECFDSQLKSVHCCRWQQMGCPAHICAIRQRQLSNHTRRFITAAGTSPSSDPARSAEGEPQGGITASTGMIGRHDENRLFHNQRRPPGTSGYAVRTAGMTDASEAPHHSRSTFMDDENQCDGAKKTNVATIMQDTAIVLGNQGVGLDIYHRQQHNVSRQRWCSARPTPTVHPSPRFH